MSYLNEALVPLQDLGLREFSIVFKLLDLSLGKLSLAFDCSHFSYFRISSIKKESERHCSCILGFGRKPCVAVQIEKNFVGSFSIR